MSDLTAPSLSVGSADDARVSDFIALLKPRVMSLVVFTGLAGMLAAPGYIDPMIGAIAVLCIAIAAGAAGAINMWYDRDIDAIMTRTARRPIPAGRVDPAEALGFGVVLTLFSIVVMGLAVNWVAATLLASASFVYVFVYTIWLKRRTPQNIVIGGASGAFPPMIGWAAVTGDVSLASFALFMLIFLWTPPHFWALALFKRGDYARAGVPMLPVVAGPESTRRQMLFYALLMIPTAMAPGLLGATGAVYLYGATALTVLFAGGTAAVLFDQGDRWARRLFFYSILYLFLVFALLIGDAMLRASGLL